MQTLGLFIVSCLGYSNGNLASCLLKRPIILSALTGLVLGDVYQGCMIGATLELVFLGAMAIGASNPPDMASGTIIGTAYVIIDGADVATAVTLAVSISMIMSFISNFFMAVVGPMLAAKADRCAQNCDGRGIDLIHLGFAIGQTLVMGAICTAGYYAGSAAIQVVVDSIPAWVTDGLNYAMGIMPAIGFAILTRMIADKKTACFLFLGFILVAYLNMNLVGVALAGLIMAAILVLNVQQEPSTSPEAETDADDNEF